MKIEWKTYNEIISQSNEKPPEMGGVLGKQNGVICRFQLDYGNGSECRCSYSPQVSVLNDTIENWQKEGIEFAGMFHTHFFGVSSLSKGDVEYISKIMKTMPSQISELVFPIIVMPNKEMVSYKAEISNGEIIISKDKIQIIGGKEK